MEPTTLRLPEDLAEALASEADEYGYGSRAEYIRRILQNRPERDPAGGDGDEPGLEQRVADLEQRLAALEETEETADGADGTGSSGETGAHEPGVWAAVERIAGDWDDRPERLAARKEAAAAVLDGALRSGEPIGRSEALDRFYDDHAVEGDYRGSWWRNTVRPVLREAGEYAPGDGGYRVDGLPREA